MSIRGQYGNYPPLQTKSATVFLTAPDSQNTFANFLTVAWCLVQIWRSSSKSSFGPSGTQKKGKTKMSKRTFVSELQCYWAEDQSWRESYNSFGSNYKQNHKVLPKQKSQGKCSIFVVYPWFPKISEISRKLLKMRRKLELVFPICRLLALLI